MKKVLVVLAIVGMFIMPMMPVKGASQTIPESLITTQNQDYTIFYPGGYNYKSGWTDVTGGIAFADANTATGNIVTFVLGITGGYAGAVLGEKLYIGRNKELNIEAHIIGLTGSDTWGEISLIYGSDHPGTSIFYEKMVIDPMLEWDDFVDTMNVISDAVGCGCGDLEDCAWLLVDAANLYNLLEQQNAQDYSVSFSVNAEKGERTIAVGIEVRNAGIIIPTYASAVGVLRYIKVQGYAPPPAPSIICESNDVIKTTDTLYKFKFESKDPNNDPVKYIIDWGDGNYSETWYNETNEPAIEVAHSYSEIGIYTIKAQAIDCDGLKSEWNSIQIEISNHKPEIIDMHVFLNTILGWEEIDKDKIPHLRNCRYQFFATDEDKDLLKFIIEYDDGTSKESGWTNGIFEDYHTYISPNYYTITVNVTDGWSYTKRDFDIYVTNSFPYAPSNPSPYNGETIYVSASSQSMQESSSSTYSATTLASDTSSQDINTNIQTANKITFSWEGGDPDGDNVTYYIYFGENSSNSLIGITENTCSYHYSGILTIGKTYYWKVVAEDEYGGINESQIWHFTVEENDSNETLPDLYEFPFKLTAIESSNGAYLIEDDIYSAGYTSTEYNQSSGGQTTGYENSANQNLQSSSLSADFSYSPSSPKVGQTVNFYDVSTGNIVSWEWNFGDGSTSNKQNPTHSYSSAGTYSVKLTVTDSNGRSSSITKSITVSINTSYQQSQQTDVSQQSTSNGNI